MSKAIDFRISRQGEIGGECKSKSLMAGRKYLRMARHAFDAIKVCSLLFYN
jgi:hypothetical protein